MSDDTGCPYMETGRILMWTIMNNRVNLVSQNLKSAIIYWVKQDLICLLSGAYSVILHDRYLYLKQKYSFRSMFLVFLVQNQELFIRSFRSGIFLFNRNSYIRKH